MGILSNPTSTRDSSLGRFCCTYYFIGLVHNFKSGNNTDYIRFKLDQENVTNKNGTGPFRQILYFK